MWWYDGCAKFDAVSVETHEIRQHRVSVQQQCLCVRRLPRICGTRGWFFEEDFKESHDEKIFRRELIRLETSLKAANSRMSRRLLCFLHYPPIYTKFRCGEILDLLKAYGVSRCVYGHLHSDSLRYAVTGQQEGIEFTLTSGDFIDFTPILLKK